MGHLLLYQWITVSFSTKQFRKTKDTIYLDGCISFITSVDKGVFLFSAREHFIMQRYQKILSSHALVPVEKKIFRNYKRKMQLT